MRIGLTGGLGSGKSTIAAIFRECGFFILEADAIARELMHPRSDLSRRITDHFGSDVLRTDGSLDRARLAELAFQENRLGELNRIVHPTVLAEQERRMAEIFACDPRAIVVIESALIFEAEAWGTVPDWHRRFDRVILVTAPVALRINRFLARVLPPDASPAQQEAAERDARARIAMQLPDERKAARSDFLIDNSGSLERTRFQALRIAAELRSAAASGIPRI